MATQTTNYGLTKPSYNETADIGVINSNMDIIDAKMKAIENKAGSGGTSVTIDSELSTTSENPVQNKVITQALNEKGTYSKPTNGIPKTDLASGVQTSLDNADNVSTLATEVDEIKGDLANSKKAIAELNDKKITKFYANSLGETTLNDSDNGKITDMFIFGKSYQYQGDMKLEDGTTVNVPNPDYPQEIQSVVNPVVKVVGKNLCGNLISGKVIDYRNGSLINDLNYLTTDYIEVKEGEIYTISNASSGDEKYYYDVNKKPIKVIAHGSNVTITIPKNAKYIRVSTKVKSKDSFQIEKGSVATEYEPYTEQLATLPYTLNAIPVSSGGNVTIDGQQYIADYVDVERKKLVRMNDEYQITGNENWTFTLDESCTKVYLQFSTIKPNNNIAVLCDKYKGVSFINDGRLNGNTICIDHNSWIRVYNQSWTSVEDAKANLQEVQPKVILPLSTPTEIDLTDEEVNVFKELATYYHTTNVIVTSDQLDGFTTFNYPLSMANGWNLIKEQLGDTRDYIYDMDLQSAEAYINSEYAVALAELEV